MNPSLWGCQSCCHLFALWLKVYYGLFWLLHKYICLVGLARGRKYLVRFNCVSFSCFFGFDMVCMMWWSSGWLVLVGFAFALPLVIDIILLSATGVVPYRLISLVQGIFVQQTVWKCPSFPNFPKLQIFSFDQQHSEPSWPDAPQRTGISFWLSGLGRYWLWLLIISVYYTRRSSSPV